MPGRIARLAGSILPWLRGNPLGKLASKIKAAGRRRVARAVGGYLAAALASTYALTAVFTPAAFTDPVQVAQVAARAGVPNAALFGVPAPLTSALEEALGAALRDLGAATGDDGLASLGGSMQDAAAEYFEFGLGALDGAQGSLARISSATAPSVPAPSAVGGGEDAAALAWDPEAAPGYYAVIDGERAVVDESVGAGQYVYGSFDALGRTTQAKAGVTVGEVRLSSGWRAGFADDVDSIAGWGSNFKAEIPYPGGGSYNGWFWNRSHLIADSLGGYEHVYDARGEIDTSKSKSQKENLVCGTRTQNVGTNNDRGSGYGGMAYFERLVVDYLEKHPDAWVYYSVEPLYAGDELIPRACRLDVKSSDWTEGSRNALNFRAMVYNAALGYDIDYRTGAVSEG